MRVQNHRDDAEVRGNVAVKALPELGSSFLSKDQQEQENVKAEKVLPGLKGNIFRIKNLVILFSAVLLLVVLLGRIFI